MSVALAFGGCVKNVPQNAKTGEDGSLKGAKELKLENNEAKATGIVTYPGGDRVDWKLIELPKDKQGALTLTLRWTPPRPGLDLSFEVLNEWYHVVAAAKPNKSRRARKPIKKVTIDGAKGKYYIQVYASERGDAGKYALTAAFAESAHDSLDWLAVTIPDPPKLPAVPAAIVACDAATFDKKNPQCKSVCPMPPDPAWPACAGMCPVPPDPNIPKCLETMPCPTPPDRKFKMCKVEDFPPCTAQIAPDERKKNPRCDTWEPPPIIAESITDVQDVDGGGVLITVGAGSSVGVGKGWKGVLLDDNDQPIRGTEFTVQRVTKDVAVGKIPKLTRDEIRRDARVRLKAK